jgi:hypothetical protein
MIMRQESNLDQLNEILSVWHLYAIESGDEATMYQAWDEEGEMFEVGVWRDTFYPWRVKVYKEGFCIYEWESCDCDDEEEEEVVDEAVWAGEREEEH